MMFGKAQSAIEEHMVRAMFHPLPENLYNKKDHIFIEPMN